VFVGLGDKVQHVLDHITRPNERTFSWTEHQLWSEGVVDVSRVCVCVWIY
jgi:hypothetical protein